MMEQLLRLFRLPGHPSEPLMRAKKICGDASDGCSGIRNHLFVASPLFKVFQRRSFSAPFSEPKLELICSAHVASQAPIGRGVCAPEQILIPLKISFPAARRSLGVFALPLWAAAAPPIGSSSSAWSLASSPFSSSAAAVAAAAGRALRCRRLSASWPLSALRFTDPVRTPPEAASAISAAGGKLRFVQPRSAAALSLRLRGHAQLERESWLQHPSGIRSAGLLD